MKVALVHDWLTGLRGGERCLLAFLRIFPDADIFTLLHLPGTTAPEIDERVRGTSFLQSVPGSGRLYRLLLPLFPRAVNSLDLSGYDLVVSLSHSAVKNVRIAPGARHICYCFTPMRYIWDQAESYFGAWTPLLQPMLRSLRAWDKESSQRPDTLVAISRFVAARIRAFYGRSAEVIHPPVDTSWIVPAQDGTRGAAFLYAGALVPYKRPDLVVQAFNQLGEELWIVGKGPLERELRRKARSNITFFGHVNDVELAGFYKKARALVFPGVEDFGMVPVECMAAGRPVIGLHEGALRETLRGLRPWNYSANDADAVQPESASGVFIRPRRGAGPAQQVSDLVEAVRFFLEHEGRFKVDSCISQADHYSPMRFYRAWHNILLRLGLIEQVCVPQLAVNR